MPLKRIRSLRALQMIYGLVLLLLVAVTGAVGTVGLALNSEWAAEARRIESFRQLAAALRGDLHRQTKEIFDYHFLQDPAAQEQFDAYDSAIKDKLRKLGELTTTDAEHEAVTTLSLALGESGAIGKEVMERPSGDIAESERLELLDTRFEGSALSGVERALEAAETTLFGSERDLATRVADRTRLAFIVLAAPTGLAILLLLVSRGFLTRALIRPLADLLDAMTAYGEGRFDHRANETGAGEMVTLQRAINRMADDLAQYRAALVRSEKQAALGALVPVIAHNIRNPLAGIRAAAQLLDNDTARGIQGAVDRLSHWLDALLVYLDPHKVWRTDAALADCADQALTMLSAKLDDKAVRIARRNWENGGTASLDSRLTEQALYGLFANAVEASPRNGAITLTVGQQNDQCWIAIEDQGPGLAFTPEPGGPLPGHTTKTHGHGLGIPFAYKICELHDGTLDFRAAPGGGARVTLSMPSAAKARQAGETV